MVFMSAIFNRRAGANRRRVVMSVSVSKKNELCRQLSNRRKVLRERVSCW